MSRMPDEYLCEGEDAWPVICQALADPNITFAAKVVYIFVVWHANGSGPELKAETLAAETGMSARSARRAVAESRRTAISSMRARARS